MVTMEIKDKRPAAPHATRGCKVRPRIFLEGNYFVDLEPGLAVGAGARRRRRCCRSRRPSAPVGFGQVLERAAEATPARTCRTVLQEYGSALARAARGAQPLDAALGAGAYRDAAIVNDATRGQLRARPLELHRRAPARSPQALDRDPAALKALSPTSRRPPARSPPSRTSLRDAIAICRRRSPRLRARSARSTPRSRRCAGCRRAAARGRAPAARRSTPSCRSLQQLRGLVIDAELGGLVARHAPRRPRPRRAQPRAASRCRSRARRLASLPAQLGDPAGRGEDRRPALPVDRQGLPGGRQVAAGHRRREPHLRRQRPVRQDAVAQRRRTTPTRSATAASS